MTCGIRSFDAAFDCISRVMTFDDLVMVLRENDHEENKINACLTVDSGLS